MNSIFQRVSIRQFADRPVEEEKIETLLRAAMAAPSATNQQPWEFVVVTDPEMLRTLSHCSPYASPMGRAPLGFVLCMRREVRAPQYAPQDMGAAAENLLLEAAELGLGAVWIGICPEEERMNSVARAVGLPREVQAFALVACGYPAEERVQTDRYDPQRVHRDRW